MVDKADSVWVYVPNQGAAIFFAVLFGLTGIGLTFRVASGGIRRFYATIIIGIIMEIVGFSFRAAARHELNQVALFAVQQTLIVLAPLFVAAGNYLMASRLILASNQLDGRKQRMFCLSARRITPVFVSCDILAIIIQSSGTSISAGDDWVGPTAKIGAHILLAGLATQTVTVAFFLAVSIRFGGFRMVFMTPDKAPKHFAGMRSTTISSIFIEIRCIYRLVEHALGYQGYPFTHEWTFYLFEALPMVFAIAILVLWYPPHHFLRSNTRSERESSKTVGGQLSRGRMQYSGEEPISVDSIEELRR